MRNVTVVSRIARFFRLIYLRLFRINDNPQKIAAGLGIGVFLGILPGTGPFAALLFAVLFRINRASALLGSILTNTWLSIPTFLLSAHVGSAVTGMRFEDLSKEWGVFVKDFHWASLLEMAAYRIIGPILIGYFIVSLCIGIAAYLITLALLTYVRYKKSLPKRA